MSLIFKKKKENYFDKNCKSQMTINDNYNVDIQMFTPEIESNLQLERPYHDVTFPWVRRKRYHVM